MLRQTRKSRKDLKKLNMSAHTYPKQPLFFFDEGRFGQLDRNEYLNNGLKQKVHSETHPQPAQDESFMRTLIKRPYQVRKYFEHPAVTYAA